MPGVPVVVVLLARDVPEDTPCDAAYLAAAAEADVASGLADPARRATNNDTHACAQSIHLGEALSARNRTFSLFLVVSPKQHLKTQSVEYRTLAIAATLAGVFDDAD